MRDGVIDGISLATVFTVFWLAFFAVHDTFVVTAVIDGVTYRRFSAAGVWTFVIGQVLSVVACIVLFWGFHVLRVAITDRVKKRARWTGWNRARNVLWRHGKHDAVKLLEGRSPHVSDFTMEYEETWTDYV